MVLKLQYKQYKPRFLIKTLFSQLINIWLALTETYWNLIVGLRKIEAALNFELCSRKQYLWFCSTSIVILYLSVLCLTEVRRSSLVTNLWNNQRFLKTGEVKAKHKADFDLLFEFSPLFLTLPRFDAKNTTKINLLNIGFFNWFSIDRNSCKNLDCLRFFGFLVLVP